MSRSLPMQIAALTHCVALSRREAGPEIIEDAEAGIKSMEWIRDNSWVIHEVKRLVTDHPALIAILREFPQAKVRIS
jgi:hypothetical protein